MEKHLPATPIETDSYIAVQLIESQHKLSFESLRYMAEEVCGNFVFTLLDASNSLWFVKGDNPLYLIHFPDLGLYIYTSTPDIMTTALQRSALHWMRYEVIDAEEGDINEAIAQMAERMIRIEDGHIIKGGEPNE